MRMCILIAFVNLTLAMFGLIGVAVGQPATLGPGSTTPVLPVPARPDILTPPGCLLARREHIKPATSRYWRGLYRDRVVVKFKDAVAIELNESLLRPFRLKAGTSVSSPGPADPSRQIDVLNAMLGDVSPRAIRAHFSATPAELKKMRLVAQERSCLQMPQLENYYYVFLARNSDGLALVERLNASPLVEIAFLPPIPANADSPPPTPNFQARQGYLSPSVRGGIDARYAWDLAGGRGEDMRVIDVEGTWNVNHEDLPAPFWFSGIPGLNEISSALNDSESANSHHGTAVAGVLVGRDDGHGITGIASKAEWGAASTIRTQALGGVLAGASGIHDASVADAVVQAAAQLREGDVILIEQHSPGPPIATSCTGSCSQYEYVPMEYFPDSFDAIATASAAGLVVVEAAGNGQVNLDSDEYEDRFDRTHRDSGAILVGSSDSSARRPRASSNRGSRLDVHAWGVDVFTAGYGDVRANGADVNQFYTSTFSGTSSASAIVAGAALSLQGVLKASGHGVLTAGQLRTLFADTGTPQDNPAADASDRIGPMPNLRSALTTFDSATASAGGEGGRRFDLRCPDGKALIGVRGRAGTVIDQLRGICADANGVEATTPIAGGSGGNAFERRCEDGRVVIGFRGRSGWFVDSLQLDCANPGDTGRRRPTRRTDVVGGSGGAVFGPSQCANDRIAVGLRGRAEAVIDNLQLSCSARTQSTVPVTRWVSAAVGGRGGDATTLDCGAGNAMVGVRINAGAWLDNIAPLCAAIGADGRWVGNVRTGPAAGGGGGQRDSVTCPRDQAVSGLSGKAATYVDRLRIRCRPLAATNRLNGAVTFGGGVGGNGGTEFGGIDCPADLPATGIAVRTGAFVDQLKLICGRDP